MTIAYRFDLWTAKNPLRRETDTIVIHHAAARYQAGQAVESIYKYHKTKWPAYNAAGYHIIIQRNTDQRLGIYVVNNPFVIGAGVLNHNHHTFHICLADDFTTTVPSDDWIEATAHAVRYAQTLFPNATIVGHRELGTTTCPGLRWFEWKPALLARVMSPVVAAPKGYTTDHPIIASPAVPYAFEILYYALTSRADVRMVWLHTDLIQWLQLYREIGTEAQVDWYMAACHALIETSYLTSVWARSFNFAHIGLTVSSNEQHDYIYNSQTQRWERALTFRSMREGVIAHIGRLVAYARTDAACTPVQLTYVDQALSHRPLPTSMRGTTTTWGRLGYQWLGRSDQTAEVYGKQLVEFANRIAGIAL